MIDKISGSAGHISSGYQPSQISGGFEAHDAAKVSSRENTIMEDRVKSREAAAPSDNTEISDEAKTEEADEKNPVNLDALKDTEDTKEKEKTPEEKLEELEAEDKKLEEQQKAKEEEMKAKMDRLAQLQKEQEELKQKAQEAIANGDREEYENLKNQYDANDREIQSLKDEIGGLKDDLSAIHNDRNTNHGQQNDIKQTIQAQQAAQQAAQAAQQAQQAAQQAAQAAQQAQQAAQGGGGNGGGDNGGGGAAPVGGNGGGNGGGNNGGGAAPVGGNNGGGGTPSTGESGAAQAVNAPTSADLKGDTAQEQIFNYLKDMGLNDTAAAGVMGNIACESGYSATNLQNSYEKSLGMSDQEYTNAVDNGSYSKNDFVHDSAGYGIVQYTYSGYKEGLYDMAKQQGKSVGDLGVQLEYLSTQMSPALIQKLNNAGSPSEAAQIFCNDFEKPGTPNMAARIDAANQAYATYA